MSEYGLDRRLAAEVVGTGFLLATIIGAGIMTDSLSGGIGGVALMGDALPIVGILVVLIWMLAPISGAHFNPAVTLAFFMRREISARDSLLYMIAQIVGGIGGAALANIMFGGPAFEIATNVREGSHLLVSEVVATFGLVFTVFMMVRFRPAAVAPAVGLYIGAAIWFTASTSFANPAVTIARSFSDSYTGIAPEFIGGFIAAQVIGAVLAVMFTGWLMKTAAEATKEATAEVSDEI